MPNTEPMHTAIAGERVASLTAIWRYPVKSMAGESLERVAVEPRGLVGDRRWAIHCGDGRLGSGKDGGRFHRLDPLFTLAAQTSAASDLGEVVTIVLPDGTYLEAGEPATDDVLAGLLGEPVALRPEAGELATGGRSLPHHDAGSVSLVGTATLAALGSLLDGPPVDARVLRANLVISTDTPYVEETWAGREVAVGAVRLRVVRRIQRCRMVDLDHVGLPGRPGLLKALGAHRDLRAAMYADVPTPGNLAVGEPVTLIA